MTTVQKGVRVRLYPTEEQEVLFNKTFGCVRFVHNQTLSDCKQSYEQTQRSQLLNFIQYKCQWYGKVFRQIDRFYASSKICSECGTYHKDIVNSLSVRKWICPDCGTHHDRDVNAAKNILNQALSVA